MGKGKEGWRDVIPPSRLMNGDPPSFAVWVLYGGQDECKVGGLQTALTLGHLKARVVEELELGIPPGAIHLLWSSGDRRSLGRNDDATLGDLHVEPNCHLCVEEQQPQTSPLHNCKGERSPILQDRGVFLAKMRSSDRMVQRKYSSKRYKDKGGFRTKGSVPVVHMAIRGSVNVGKTAFCVRHIYGDFVARCGSGTDEVYRKQCIVDGEQVFVDISETDGPQGIEEGPCVEDAPLSGVLLMYSITDRASLTHVKEIARQGQVPLPLVLVGNKADLDRQRVVSYEEGVTQAREFDCVFLETSVRNAHNLDTVLQEFVREVRWQMYVKRKIKAKYGNKRKW